MPGFEQLEAYQAARKLRQRVYKLTGQLPKDEKFVLVPQMRRAALAVTNHIAQSHGGDNWKQQISILHRARGSVHELVDAMGLCEDQGYFKAEHLSSLRADADEAVRLITEHIGGVQQQLDAYMAERRNKARAKRPPQRSPGGGRRGNWGNREQ